MKYFSMFSGVGGFELGIDRAIPLAECVGYSEIDDYAIKTYEDHFNDHKNYGSATDIHPPHLPDFDLLVGGFPCQAFSVAGKRRGFDEARGTLFFDIARILKHKRPRHLVLENVKGLLSHDSGKTFQVILGVLTDLGYRVEWQVLNSKNFGVPQNRERVYIIGHLRDGCGSQILPITGADSKDSRVIGQDVAYTIDANYAKGTNTLEKSRRSLVDAGYGQRPPRIYNDHAPTNGSGGNKMPMVVTPHIRWGKGQRTTSHSLEEIVPTIRASQHKSGDNQAKILQEARIRRLTPVECERLQGFPDNWTLGSNTQRYKQCGNAVTVNVVQAVMERLCS